MKKNKIMRAALLMLALTLITSSFVGGTLAKYVTSGEGTDTARVAKFGVTINATGAADLFKDAYALDDKLNYTVALAGDNSVQADVDVVAPGTMGSLGTFTVSGKPEVAVSIKRTVTIVRLDNWVDEKNNFYCPLVFTVGTDSVSGSNFYGNKDGFTTALKGLIEKETVVKAGEDIPPTALATIEWEWPFEGGTASNQTDERDTFLGNAANPGVIELTITASATQID